MVLSIRSGKVVLVALLFIALPAQADEIEPEPEPAPIAKPEPEPEPEPAPEPVVASEDEEFPEPSWIPSVEVGFEAYSHDFDTTITNLIDPTTWSETQSGEADQILLRFGGELMGPMFEDLPGRPRLFVQGGVGIRTFSDDRVFELGNPGIEALGDSLDHYYFNGPGDRDLPSDFEGQGSLLDADLQDPTWYAGLGIAFSVPASSGLLFYIKPSVQYIAEDMDFEGGLLAVYEPPPPGVDPEDGPYTRDFQVRQSIANFSTTDHSIGPSLEVAMAFLSPRPIRVSIFAQIRALWLVSDKTNSFADSDGVASYSVERDDLAIRGGAGVRFSWVGFH
ncbi:MAG: hypothetical protein JRE38_06800 [Deltaproteobacteria bacterium]|nr:hypothetical protein [Deltaproteobacteria bacterium]MBW2693088.1 hypothetical protein [Deltaproteobacteria bacterium]